MKDLFPVQPEADEQRGAIGVWENERDAFGRKILAYDGPELERGREAGRRLSLDEAVQIALD